MTDQLSLPMPVQARPLKREPARLWAYVCALRAAGHRVRRAGRLHLVNGRMVDTDQLRKLARQVGR